MYPLAWEKIFQSRSEDLAFRISQDINAADDKLGCKLQIEIDKVATDT